MGKEFHVEASADGADWEVRDRADVFVSSHETKGAAQQEAARMNKQVGH